MRVTYFFTLLVLMLIALFLLACPSPRRAKLGAASETAFCRIDAAALGVIILVYAIAAFTGLGDTHSAQSFHKFQSGESAVIDLGEVRTLDSAMLYSGLNTGSYYIEASDDGEHWQSAGSFEQNYVALFKWNDLEALSGVSTRYIRLTAQGSVWLGELGIRCGGRLYGASSDAPELFDEQEQVPEYQYFTNSSYFDEIYHARTALENIEGIYPYEVSHPPLGKLIIAMGIMLFGMTPFGWRFSGALFGVLMLPVMYVFIKKLFGRSSIAACGTAIFAFDFMHFVQTRIATIDTYAVFFILLMYLFMYLYITGGRLRHLALSGVFFGLGAASKWTCIYAGAGLAVIWALHWIVRAHHRKDDERGGDLFGKFLCNCGFCVVFFVLVPAVIYYVSYYHYGAAKGLTGIGAFFTKEYAQIVLDNQTFMFTYHSGVTASHPYSSRWYQWVLDIRPILYYLDYGTDGTRQSFGAFVNPILCWAGLIALFVLGYEAAAKRDRRAAFILIGYLAQLLPWVFITRITFEYHYFACTVFLVLALGYVIALMRQWNQRWRVYAVGMAVLCVAVFIMFYPALSGMRVDNAAASRLLRWLPTWPF